MKIDQHKINERGHGPGTGDGRFVVYSQQYNKALDQIGSQLNDMTLHEGQADTSSMSTGAEASETVTISDDNAKTSDKVLAVIRSYSGTYSTNGLPTLGSAEVTSDGTISVEIMNPHSTNALSGTLTIDYLIIKKA